MRLKRRKRRHLAGSIILALFLLVQLTVAADVLARAGGGGSSSGGSSGGSSSSSSSSGGDGTTSVGGLIFMAAFMVFFVVVVIQAKKQEKKRREAMRLQLVETAKRDPAWEQTALETRVREVFLSFQKAWSEFDLKTMETLLTQNYYRRMVLELNVLSNMKRRNSMDGIRISACEIMSVIDDADDAKDRFEAMITASAKDSIVDLASDKVLHTDQSTFIEYWTFRREAGVWKLDSIRQATAARHMFENQIASFAEKNGFYFDPDFGWLMMPDKGVLFGKYGFGKADINNHVVGYYRDKIVEFYTYIPNSSDKDPTNYLVAQAILPISYHDVLIRKKTKGLLFGPSKPAGLNQMTLEFGDFNEKFEVFAHPEDRINSLELLTPNFMVKIFDLPFELNIELVGNVLYLYTAKRDVSYDQMLEVLSWAFDDMKK